MSNINLIQNYKINMEKLLKIIYQKRKKKYQNIGEYKMIMIIPNYINIIKQKL